MAKPIQTDRQTHTHEYAKQLHSNSSQFHSKPALKWPSEWPSQPWWEKSDQNSTFHPEQQFYSEWILESRSCRRSNSRYGIYSFHILEGGEKTREEMRRGENRREGRAEEGSREVNWGTSITLGVGGWGEGVNWPTPDSSSKDTSSGCRPSAALPRQWTCYTSHCRKG